MLLLLALVAVVAIGGMIWYFYSPPDVPVASELVRLTAPVTPATSGYRPILTISTDIEAAFEAEAVDTCPSECTEQEDTTVTPVSQPEQPPPAGIQADHAPADPPACYSPPVPPTHDYIAQIDYYLRHREDFYSPGYIYNIDRLRKELPPPRELRLEQRFNYLAFLKAQREVRVIGAKSIELTCLTPYRLPGRVYGYFHCVVNYCHSAWENADSFADKYQLCWKCGAKVYPFAQSALPDGTSTACTGTDSDTSWSSTSSVQTTPNMLRMGASGYSSNTPTRGEAFFPKKMKTAPSVHKIQIKQSVA